MSAFAVPPRWLVDGRGAAHITHDALCPPAPARQPRQGLSRGALGVGREGERAGAVAIRPGARPLRSMQAYVCLHEAGGH